MGFIKDAARGGLFGLAGSLIAGKDKKKEPRSSLVTGDWNAQDSRSLLNEPRKQVY